MKQTAVEWLFDTLSKKGYLLGSNGYFKTFKEAKAMEKEHMIGFAEFVAKYPDKNRNYLNQMLHAKSKYDGAEKTVDLLEEYYRETLGQGSNDTNSHQ